MLSSTETAGQFLPAVEPTATGEHLKISLEIFPPKTEAMAQRLWTELARLQEIRPSFISVTYGAGGTTRATTFDTVTRLQRETPIWTAAHLTCVGASRAEVNEVAMAYWQAGVRHIVALRGDPQDADGVYRPHEDGYAYAADLVAGLKRLADFEVSVAAYPEAHPEADSVACDLDNLKRKFDAGADRALTQFFFDPECFLRFRDRAVAAGIERPIVPGILPITDFAKTKQFAAKCGATIPDWLSALFDGLPEDSDTLGLVAAVAAAEQCRQLQTEGVDSFHFYTLNRAELTTAICRLLRNPIPVAAIPALGRGRRA